MSENLSPIFTFVGRILISAIFLFAGFGKLTNWHGTAGYMASHGMHAVPFFLAAAIVVELGGGLLLVLGYKARFSAAVLFLFLIPVTMIFHAFWAVPPEQHQVMPIMFMKNVAIMGGLLGIVANGPGAWSIDGRKPLPQGQPS